MKFVVENFEVLSKDAAHIQELKDLVLDMAFHGKLTNQTSEDESGELLLQRIKSKQEQLNKEGRIGKLTKYKSLGEDEIPVEIPESWIWCRLGELGETQTGTTPSRSNPEYYGTFIPFLGPGDLQNGVINYENKALSKLGIEKGRLIKKESILMVCIGGSIGKSVLVDRDVSCNQQINTITPIIALSDYLHYGMQANFFQTSLLKKASGSATPIINKGKWERLPFPLAPLPEQRRIVQKVNHLFRQIDALAAGAEQAEGVRRRLRAVLLHRLEQAAGRTAAGRAWVQLEEQFALALRRVEDVQALRQSILQLAVKGLLVEQNPQDEPASVLLERIKEEKARLVKEGKIRKQKKLPAISEEEMPFEAPEGWGWCRLGETSIILMGQSPKGSSYNSEGLGVPLINGPVEFGKGPFDKTILSKWTTEPTKMCIAGDLLVCVRGATTGRTNIAGFDACIGRGVASVRSMIFERYLHFFMLHSRYRILSLGTGTTFPSISQDDLKNLCFPLPPLAEQRRIVERVEGLLGWCDRLEAAMGEKEEKEGRLVRASVHLNS
ncbi:MAG: restriction endonuclease subunit S [Lewinellaceae bacterium]|nr:restriction endonuclease subunit S [Phaeodactylibacter sp.]MCB9037542.1 restriction endonuclease subunit S [Lewinellaceae bacterium]